MDMMMGVYPLWEAGGDPCREGGHSQSSAKFVMPPDRMGVDDDNALDN